jgi:hypothetical protein
MSATDATYGDPRLPDRFWRRVKKSTSGCWLWTGHITSTGYGHYPLRHDKPVRAHRYLYDQLVEPVYGRGHPDYRDVDHECHNHSKTCKGGPSCLHRRCVNPAHLRAKTPKANSMASPHSTASVTAAAMSARTHCPQGHPYAGENLYTAPGGGRRCRTCAKEADHRRRPLTGERPGPKLKTHCRHGHELAGDNLYVSPTGARHCRTCRTAAGDRYQAKVRTIR